MHFPSGSSVAVADASARQVVGTHFHPYPVAEQNSDPESTHLAAGVGQELVPVVKPDRELRVPHRVNDGAVHFQRVSLRHQPCAPINTSARSASVSSRAARRYARKASGEGWSLALRSASSRSCRRSKWTAPSLTRC